MNRLFLLLLLLPLELFAQGEYLIQIPISSDILKKNKVSTVNVLEKIDSFMVQTNTYFVNEDGKVFEHIYYDPALEGSGPFEIEKLRWSKDTAGFVQFTLGIYSETGELNTLLSNQECYYSPTGKLIEVTYHEFMDYHSIRKFIFDTINPEFVNKTEWRILNNDTLFLVKDFENGLTARHELKNKVNGKWEETEISISTFNNGKLETYELYKNGKIVQKYDSREDFEKRISDEVEQDYGLPVPEPFTKFIYSNKMDLIYESNAKEKSAKFRLELKYENGKESDLGYYEVYDNKSNLLLITSDIKGEYKTEFHYLFRK